MRGSGFARARGGTSSTVAEYVCPATVVQVTFGSVGMYDARGGGISLRAGLACARGKFTEGGLVCSDLDFCCFRSFVRIVVPLATWPFSRAIEAPGYR